jgi:hypothetical protein
MTRPAAVLTTVISGLPTSKMIIESEHETEQREDTFITRTILTMKM